MATECIDRLDSTSHPPLALAALAVLASRGLVRDPIVRRRWSTIRPPRARIPTIAFVTAVVASLGVGGATGAQPGTTRYVSEIRPVQGPSRVLAAQRSSAVIGLPRRAALAPDAHPWRLQDSLPGVVIKDLSFASPSVGYLAAELGQVWKTSDGGQTWTRVMNLGFPYYWYGVDALTETDVVVSGFNNSNFQGILRWSHDGGLTWSSDVILTTDGWSFRVRFADPDHGLV